MALRGRLQDGQDVEEFQALLDRFWLLDNFLKAEAEIVDHVPNEVGQLEKVKEGHETAADELKDLSVVDLGIDVLAECDLVFLALAELVVVVTPQFKYVLW